MSSYSVIDGSSVQGPTGPTPIPVLIGRELSRIALARGARRRGWLATYDAAGWTVVAYVGSPSESVAMVCGACVHTALLRLLGDLFQVTKQCVQTPGRGEGPQPVCSDGRVRTALPVPHATIALSPATRGRV